MVNLTIGGGSFKGLAFLGALEYLHINNYINNIEHFHGCSIGSIMGVFYIIGFTPFEMLDIFLKLDLRQFWDINLNNIDKSYSILSDTFFKTINNIFKTKEDINITIGEFYCKYNVNINIHVVSIKQRKSVIFNKDTYPNLKVLTAIQASASIPIIFPPVKIDNDYYVDGCTKCLNGHSSNNTTGYIIKLNNKYNEIDSFSTYISQLLQCMLTNEENVITKNTIEIELDSKYNDKIDFSNITYSDKIKLYYDGLTQAKKIFSSI